ncbi:MAG: hypothetical protein ACOVS5_05345 [Oligoflexus sp.]|jgi:hypothetical protein
MTRILFHLLPLLPLAFGLHWLALATSLLVLVSYVKVMKIEQQISDLQRKNAHPDELASLERTRRFWLGLTFLKQA